MKRNNKNEKIFKMSKKQKYIYCKTLWLLFCRNKNIDVNFGFWELQDKKNRLDGDNDE